MWDEEMRGVRRRPEEAGHWKDREKLKEERSSSTTVELGEEGVTL